MQIFAWSVRRQYVDLPRQGSANLSLQGCLESALPATVHPPWSWHGNGNANHLDFWPEEDAVLRVLTDLRNGSPELDTSLLEFWKLFWEEAQKRGIRQLYSDDNLEVFESAQAEWRTLWAEAVAAMEEAITLPRGDSHPLTANC